MMRITKKQFAMLQLCASVDANYRQGIAPLYLRHFKPGSRRTLNSLIKRELVKIDHRFGAAITTDAGDRVYWNLPPRK